MKSLMLTLNILFSTSIFAQQVPDSSFQPKIGRPSFETDSGPIVMLDEAHFNFHTISGRYYSFARVLRLDGYRVVPSSCQFTQDSLKRGQLLVIANALNERNAEDWSLPTPSAFTPDEIEAVRQWVESGGSLLLIADHMPFPGAAQDLAKIFGFSLNDGFAGKAEHPGGNDYFHRADQSLTDHPITNGRDSSERIDSVVSFTGQAFQIDSAAVGLMRFGAGMVSYMPSVAWQFTDSTPRVDVAGWWQAAAREYGKGRVVMMGEAAMFSAQLAGPDRTPVGMNSPNATQNPQFLLNVIHWLTRAI